MSDLHPRPRSESLELVDPAVTRLFHRDGTAAPASLFHRLGPVATSISFIVPDETTPPLEVYAAVRRWKTSLVRSEVIATVRPEAPRLVPPPDALSVAASDSVDPTLAMVPFRQIRRSLGGRAAVLASCIEAAQHEFVVLTSSHECSLTGMTAAIGHMWAEGCDVALVESPTAAIEDPLAPPLGSTSVDAAEELALWLGPAVLRTPGRLVVLRRWVARWLFNEVTRAIDPWVEIADRDRLLGIGIVSMDDRVPSHDPVKQLGR